MHFHSKGIIYTVLHCLQTCHHTAKYLVQILPGVRFYDVANVPWKHIGSGGVKQRCGESEHPPDQDISFVTLPDE